MFLDESIYKIKIFPSYSFYKKYIFICRIEAWEVLQQAKEDGMVKHIGVSNWNDVHLSNLMNDDRCKIVPELNQIENHPYHVGQSVIDYCNDHQILIQAYGPLGNGLSDRAKGGPDGELKRVLDDPEIKRIADTNELTPAQVLFSNHEYVNYNSKVY